MTSSPDDRTDQVDDSPTPSVKATTSRPAASAKTSTPRTAAKKTPAKRAPAKKAAATPASTRQKTAAESAAPSGEVIIEPTVKMVIDPADRTNPQISAARTTATARAAAAKNTAARATGAKASAAGARKAPAAKTAAARTAAAKAAAAKASARSTSAKTTAAKTTAAKAAAAKAAAAKAAAAKAAAAEAAAAEKAAAESAALEETTASTAARETEQPIVEEPAVEEPIVEEPTVEEPAVELPPVEEPVVEEPAVDEPVADEPAVEEPIVDEPPVEEPVAEEPSAEEQPTDDDADSVEVVTPVADFGDAASANDGEVGEASATEAISIRGLVKQFGDNRAVDGIDLTVPAGSFYGIVGPNGAGKTTTLSIVAGLLRADEGSVVICGIDQAKQPHAAKRVMGVLPDRLRTFDRLTGRQLLYYYGLLRGLAADVIEKRAADLARAFDLGDALSRVVSDYSAGMTKKIMLAGAMIHSPRVLVLDEPFESVDPVSSAVILDILRAYVSHGGTVILSSHGMDLVERVCSRVAIIVGGEVLAEGTIDEVRAGQTLEARFVELAGSSGEVEGLEWLHTFSA